jgi:exonuclease SbcD
MKIIHIADIHYNKERKNDVLMALRAIKDNANKNAVDMIAIAGDIFDSAMLNSESQGYPELLDAFKALADCAPVCLIQGTPSHDVDGTLSVFPKLHTMYGITILEPGQAYFLHKEHGIIREDEIYLYDALGQAAILFGIPEPRKKYLLVGEALGKDETEEAVRDALHRLCFHLAAKRREYPDIPCALVYHGAIAGSSLQNEQTIERGTGISITIDDLADIGADFNFLGHIHKPQQVGNIPAYYAGSLIPKNFGESHKAGFNLITLDVGKYSIERIDIDYPQNLKLELLPDEDPYMQEVLTGRRVWAEYTCTREERSRIDVGAILEQLLGAGAAPGSRVTVNELPV